MLSEINNIVKILKDKGFSTTAERVTNESVAPYQPYTEFTLTNPVLDLVLIIKVCRNNYKAEWDRSSCYFNKMSFDNRHIRLWLSNPGTFGDDISVASIHMAPPKITGVQIGNNNIQINEF